MDPVQLFQQTLAGIMGGNQFNQTLSDVAQNVTVTNSTTTSPASPLNLPALLSFLLSFSALRDWLKLIVIGGVIETCRRFGLKLWSSLVESFWITACFDERDTCYSQ